VLFAASASPWIQSVTSGTIPAVDACAIAAARCVSSHDVIPVPLIAYFVTRRFGESRLSTLVACVA